ncbi:hypothetical protein VPH35_050317 [Triticum aestivum]
MDSENLHGALSENKVTSALMSIRKALEEQIEESSSRELCILTTLACSEPPLLEETLNRIKVIRELELHGVDDGRRKLYPSAEESLKHLLWLREPETVFNAALGLYDLSLAAIVALNSQKDPKEFLPFLKGLECLPPSFMRYTIDLKLSRYESALRNIVSPGLLNFTKEDILQLAQELCDEFQALGKPGDAAKTEHCLDVDRGVGCYIMAREWEEALRVAYMHSRQDLVDTVKDAALEFAALLISEYQEGLLKVGKYLARYVAVRKRRLSLAAKLQSKE